jgi:hypothetical protein
MILDVFLQEMKELSEKKNLRLWDSFLSLRRRPRNVLGKKAISIGKRMENGWNRVP